MTKLMSLAEVCRSPLLFLDVLGRTLTIEIALRILDLKKIEKFCSQSRLPLPKARKCDLQKALKFSGMVERHLFGKPSCLRSSFVLYWMAPQKAYLQIGVMKDLSFFEAHAWVEVDQQIFSGTVQFEKYEKLLTFHKFHDPTAR